jgi:cytochrome P450
VAVDLSDPDWYLGDDVHTTFAELRRRDPVHWQDMAGEPGYWAVLRHADAVHVSRHPETFSSWLGGTMMEDPDPAGLEASRLMLLTKDPPEHTVYRQPLAPHFGARVIAAMEARVRARCRELLRAAGERGDVEFCHEVAAPLGSETMAEIMGLPREDAAQLRQWAELLTGGQDEEVATSYTGSAMADMATYAIKLAATRRRERRRDDVTTLLLESTFEDGEPMTDIEFGSFFVQLVGAGNDTTRTLISSGTAALVRHPEQLHEAREEPQVLSSAVEEMLRYCTPVHYQRRTATTDTELGGARIRAGDKVVVCYTSANRDEQVFTDPQRFDIHRSPNPHLSFGIGAHYCLGAHVARLQARVFFEELLGTFRTIELTEEPTRLRSNFINSYRRMPVSLRR